MESSPTRSQLQVAVLDVLVLRQNAAIHGNSENVRCNYLRSEVVEGKGFVDCALNSDATLARTT